MPLRHKVKGKVVGSAHTRQRLCLWTPPRFGAKAGGKPF